jgi:trans-aconitate 2-methyltransferase
MTKPSEHGAAQWSGSHYDSVSDPQFRWGVDILSRLGDVGSGAVLDAGCGSGRVTEVLCGLQSEADVIAGDISPTMLEEAEKRLARFGPRVRYLRVDLNGDLAALSGLAPFAAVVSTGTLHWVTDHDRFYRSIFAMLRPGAPLVAQCGGEGSVESVRLALEDLGVEWRGFNHYAGAADTARLLEQAGFEDVWTWLHPEPAEFEDRQTLVDYLLGGVLAPYVARREAGERREIAEAVADRLESPVVDFVRLNILARRPR